MHTCMCIMHTYMPVHTCTHIQKYVHTYLHMGVHMYAHTHPDSECACWYVRHCSAHITCLIPCLKQSMWEVLYPLPPSDMELEALVR